MSGLSSAEAPAGVLRAGFQAAVDDYAIAGAFGLGGKVFLVGDAGGNVYAFDGSTGKQVWCEAGVHPGGVMDMAVSKDGQRLASVGQDGRLALWQIAAGRLGPCIDVADAWVEHVAWAPDGKHVAVASGRKAVVYAETGERVWSSAAQPSTVSALRWATDIELAIACYGRVTFCDVLKAQETQRLEWQGSLVSLALSPDSDIVACGSQDNSVHFWRRTTGQDAMMSGYPLKPSVLAFSADGVLLATGGSATITVWSFAGGGPEGTQPGALELHAAPIAALTFAHHSRRLASGGRDSGVVVWELERDGSGRAIGTALARGAVERVYFRADDRALVAIDGEGGVTGWRVR